MGRRGAHSMQCTDSGSPNKLNMEVGCPGEDWWDTMENAVDLRAECREFVSLAHLIANEDVITIQYKD